MRYRIHVVEAAEERVGTGCGGAVSVDRKDADMFVAAADRDYTWTESGEEEGMKTKSLLISTEMWRNVEPGSLPASLLPTKDLQSERRKMYRFRCTEKYIVSLSESR